MIKKFTPNLLEIQKKTDKNNYYIKIMITSKKWYELVAEYDEKHIYKRTKLIMYELLPWDFDGGYGYWHIHRNDENDDEDDDEDDDEEEEILCYYVKYWSEG